MIFHYFVINVSFISIFLYILNKKQNTAAFFNKPAAALHMLKLIQTFYQKE